MNDNADRDKIRAQLAKLPAVERIKIDGDDTVWTAWNEIATSLKMRIYTRTVPGGFEVWRRP